MLTKAEAGNRTQVSQVSWQAPNYLSHQLVPPRVHSNKKLESAAELRLEARYSNIQPRSLKQHLNCGTKHHSYFSNF